MSFLRTATWMHVLFAAAATLAASRSDALVDMRLTGGMYDGTAKVKATGTGSAVPAQQESMKNKGTQMTAAVGVSPLPLVPVSFGVFYSMVDAKGDTTDLNTKWQGSRGGLDLTVWAPVPKFKPYLRAGYYLFGSEKLTASLKTPLPTVGDVSTVYEGNASGYQVGLGVGFSLAPFVSLYLDYSMDKTELKTKKVDVTAGSVTATTDLPEDFKASNDASTISLGVGVSL